MSALPARAAPPIAPDAPVVIRVSDLVKTYRLYNSLTEQALDIMGLGVLRFWRRRTVRFYSALKGVSFELRKGERLGIVGRNGAGKSTLLKLFNDNFQATSGHVEVNGEVQALLHTGLGFYPEFTGYENLRSALLYNGLPQNALDDAISEIVEFVELGEFLHQPFKTYSMGMRTRLQFAAATAIHPDILLIDEVLGAGDAYFTAKSALRVKALTGSGCTLILVSHSMEQVLQFCERAIWLEDGAVVMDGPALPVVRAYEEFSRRLEHESLEAKATDGSGSILGNDMMRAQLLEDVLGRSSDVDSGALADGSTEAASRWPGVEGLKIRSVRIYDSEGTATWEVRARERVDFEMIIEAEVDGTFECRYVVVIFAEDGRLVSRLSSDTDRFTARKADRKRVVLRFPMFELGNGKYVFSAAVYKRLDLLKLDEAVPYDLLGRAFEFQVVTSDPADPSLLMPEVEWQAATDHR